MQESVKSRAAEDQKAAIEMLHRLPLTPSAATTPCVSARCCASACGHRHCSALPSQVTSDEPTTALDVTIQAQVTAADL